MKRVQILALSCASATSLPKVQQLRLTRRAPTKTGQKLMVVVPDGTKLEIEAMLLNRDKGFVREGQEVRI